ncbi:hypothetical protein TEA_005141 [Camellia sinensis var. sinensis]|uniref:MLO-like protein n=1 Tax=Camellia sinensis var. sinensis TaxID=542762 RepID=A0A4S4EA42_CAMSN|nr:hypothetical protein TEA_005141 [Camellia sinensis var. sinensis]
MAGDSSSSIATRELTQTPTWAVAGVCAVIIIISITMEKGLHKFGTYLSERHKKALYEALEKVKAELMILGFISLLLTFGQKYIVKICIPTNVADTLLPCPLPETSTTEAHKRRLLWFEQRILAEASSSTSSSTSSCKSGKVPLISTEGVHQLHILIFFLAVLHVLYSAVTMALGRLKIRGWKQWELETASHDYEFSNDPSRFRLTHETSFVRAHTSFWTRIPLFFYIGCFFRQFFRSVSKSDYLTLRNGFISIILLVGTKLQAILTMMALEITERHAVVQGIPLVQGSNKYFWFGRPQLVLHLIHFALFQNAFQITYLLWIWYLFGLQSCFHDDNFKLVIVKIALGFGVLFLCSYITLPLYALIAQMGTHMKKSIFDEQTSKALKKWHMAVKKKHRQGGKSPTQTLGGESPSLSASVGSTLQSAGAALHRFKTTGHSTRLYEDRDLYDFEAEPLSPTSSTTPDLILRIDDHNSEIETSAPQPQEESRKEDDFSFVKLAPVK